MTSESNKMDSLLEPMLFLRARRKDSLYGVLNLEPELRFPYDSQKVTNSPAEKLLNNVQLLRFWSSSYLLPTFVLMYFTSYLSLIFLIGKVGSGFVFPVSIFFGMAITLTMLATGTGLHAMHKRTLNLRKLIAPSAIVISPSKIGLTWGPTRLSSLVSHITWEQVALVHMERHKDAGQIFHVLSIRTFTGQALLIDSRCFSCPDDFSALLKAISTYARHAISNPALALAIQKTQLYPTAYCLLWELQERIGVFRFLPDKKSEKFSDLTISPGTQLKKGRYEIIEHKKTDLRSVSYRARTIDARIEQDENLELLGIKEDSKPVLFRDLTTVTIKQYIIARRHKSDICDETLMAFEQAVRAITMYRHKNIVRWLDVFVDNGRAFVVFEHLTGQCLHERVATQGPLPLREALDILIEICDIIESLHYKQIKNLRLDFYETVTGFGYLSPDCFIITEQKEPKLVELPILEKISSSANLSAGIPINYSAPEAFEGVILPQSDIYSLGCISHFLLTGEEPAP
ncbi:MAG: hypothetical protein K8F91_04030, partial [Candidatus Obscuribacterales bacterium]|nr:hypothetical protein [Candidatus Obscuribacterales bacterium]